MKVAVIGAGAMGSGIAQTFAQCDAVEKQVQDAPGEPPRRRQGAFCPTAGPNITKQEKMH